MNTQEIEVLLSDLQGFKGVHPSDEIPVIRIKRSPQCFVMNIDPASMPGSHWISICVTKLLKKKVIELFDSYGTSLKGVNLPKGWMFRQNKHRIQDFTSKVCGHYCVFFTRKRLSGMTFQKIIKSLRKMSNPDKTVRMYVARLKNRMRRPSLAANKRQQISLPATGGCLKLPFSIKVKQCRKKNQE